MSSTDSSSSMDVVNIVGIVIGGVLGLATIIILIVSFYFMCCKKNNQSKVWAQPAPYYPPNGAYGQPMYTGYYSQQPPNQQSEQPSWNKPSANNDQPPTYSSVYPGSNSY